MEEQPNEALEELARLDLMGRTLDETLAFVQRDTCRWGFGEAAAILALVRQSIKDDLSKRRSKVNGRSLRD